MAKNSIRVVVDASVARAAGSDKATHPTSTRCRDLLQSILEVCHRIVLDPHCWAEWVNHQSAFTRRWLTLMYARRKVDRVEIIDASDLERKLRRCLPEGNDLNAVLKDIDLITVASHFDRHIVTLDNHARDMCAALSQQVQQLKTLIWINPSELEIVEAAVLKFVKA